MSATTVSGLIPVSRFYWDQDDQARSFAVRSIAAADQMPDVAHAVASAVVRDYPPAANVAEGLDATPINQKTRGIAAYFFDRSIRPRPAGRLAAKLFLPRFKPPGCNRWGMGSLRADRCHSAADIYRLFHRMGRSPGHNGGL